jgi:hypothetical protein
MKNLNKSTDDPPGMELDARVELVGVGLLHSSLLHLGKRVTWTKPKLCFKKS